MKRERFVKLGAGPYKSAGMSMESAAALCYKESIKKKMDSKIFGMMISLIGNMTY